MSTCGAARENCTCSIRRRCSSSSTRPGNVATRCFGNTPRRWSGSIAKAARCAGLFAFREGVRPPVPLDEVEPVSEIVRRFATGAMSYGSISAESHETLAIAMNRIGGKSNCGEGGEDARRFTRIRTAICVDPRSSKLASGRFGVTRRSLVNADDEVMTSDP